MKKSLLKKLGCSLAALGLCAGKSSGAEVPIEERVLVGGIVLGGTHGVISLANCLNYYDRICAAKKNSRHLLKELKNVLNEKKCTLYKFCEEAKVNLSDSEMNVLREILMDLDHSLYEYFPNVNGDGDKVGTIVYVGLNFAGASEKQNESKKQILASAIEKLKPSILKAITPPDYVKVNMYGMLLSVPAALLAAGLMDKPLDDY